GETNLDAPAKISFCRQARIVRHAEAKNLSHETPPNDAQANARECRIGPLLHERIKFVQDQLRYVTRVHEVWSRQHACFDLRRGQSVKDTKKRMDTGICRHDDFVTIAN